MDFGKFKYQLKKKLHKGQTHQAKIKEIRVRPKTDGHDIEVKASRAREFLTHKDKVNAIGPEADVPIARLPSERIACPAILYIWRILTGRKWLAADFVSP